QLSAKTRQTAAVMYLSVTSDRVQLPTKAVRIRRAAIELDRGPHLFATWLLEKSFGVKRGVPLRQIQHVGKKGTAGPQGQIDGRVGILPFSPAISVGAILHQVSHRGRARRVHFERLKQSVAEVFTPGLAANFPNDLSQRKVPDVAVLPLFSRRETQRQGIRRLNHIRVGLNFKRVKTGSFADNARGVRQQMPDSDRLPALGRAVEKLADTVVETNLAFLN